MVKVTAIVLASFAIAPLVFAAANPVDSDASPAARALDDDLNLEARAPSPEPFKGLIRRFKRIANNRWLRKAVPYAGALTKIIARDENGDLYIRDVDLSDLSERDLDELDMALEARDFEDFDELESREPRRWGLKGAFRKFKSITNKARPFLKYAKFVHPAAAPLSLLGREFDEDELDARDYEDLVDLLEREFEDDLDLDAREPWWGSDLVRKAKKAHHQGAGVLQKANEVNGWLGKIGLRELEDLGLEERDFDDELDLDAREPWWGSNLVRKAKKVHHQGANVLTKANEANNWLSKIGLRELEDLGLEERDFADEFDLDAREPWWGSDLVRKAKKAHHQGAGVLQKANEVNGWLGKIGLRELEEDMEERSFEDLDALD